MYALTEHCTYAHAFNEEGLLNRGTEGAATRAVLAAKPAVTCMYVLAP
jgi:hypothetical protein